MVAVVVVAAVLLAACGDNGGGSSPLPDVSTDVPENTAPQFGYFLFAPPKIAAKPSARNLIRVIGTQMDGTPATDELVLNFDRPDSGTYTAPVVTLGPLGATSIFSACDVGTPGCVGPLTLTAALASAPTVPIASRAIEIVDPVELDPTTPCRGGGNVLYLKGNDQIFTGESTITGATFAFTSDYPEYLVVGVTPAASINSWRLAFDLRGFGSGPLMLDVYDNVVKSEIVLDSDQYYRSGLDISGFGNSCSSVTGRFEVVEYVRDGSGAARFSIAFEQHCEGSATSVLTGCVHYER